MVEVKSFKWNFLITKKFIHIYLFSKKENWMKTDHVFFMHLLFSFDMMRIKWWWYRDYENIRLLWIMVFPNLSFFIHHALHKKTRFQLCFTWENLCAWLVKINMKNDFHTNNKKIIRPYHISRPILLPIIVVYGINLS